MNYKTSFVTCVKHFPHSLIVICQHDHLLQFCNGNTRMCEVAVCTWVEIHKYHHLFISSTVSYDKQVFYISDISEKKRVHLTTFNTEDHTQRGWKYRLFHPVSVLVMLYIHSQSRGFKESRDSASFSGFYRANCHFYLLSSC